MWLERLQTLVKGEIWGGEGKESEVKVNEGILSQLVSQGFDRTAAQAALRKTNNDDFAALLILTCPEDTSDQATKGKSREDAAADSDEAKEQRFLDFFRDLGDQYWGWQNESAKRGRGFKGALKENFLPLLNDLRQLASEDLPFSSSPAIAYHAMCFLNRGFDECPPASEDRDRDRHRMSLETAHIVPSLVKRIAGFSSEDFGSSLVCELVKETFAVLDKLVVSTVSSRLTDSAREESVKTIVGFITRFYSLMEISKDNAGLPGASGKLSAVHLHSAIRSLSLFISIPTITTAAHLITVAAQLSKLGEYLEKNDPSVVEAVLSALSSFVQPFTRLTQADCDAVLGPFLEVDGPIARRLLALLATSTHAKIHALVVSFLSSVCQLSGQVVEQLIGATCDGEMEDDLQQGTPASADTKQRILFDCVARALTSEGSQVRARGVLNWIDSLLGCITEGHKAQKRERERGTGVRLVVEDADLQRRLSDAMVEDDMEEMELREMLDHDELRDDEAQFRSRSSMDPSDRRRAELEIRLHRLRRGKISRMQEARTRRRFNAAGAELASAGEGSAAAGRSLTASPVLGRELVSGTRVKRGPNWKWNSQDGGPGNEGVVVSGTEKNSDGWVRVKWDKGGVNGYRWGAESAYDVEPVDAKPLSKAIRDKDVDALLEACKDAAGQISGTSGVLLEVLSLAAEGTVHGKDSELLTVLIEQLGADPNKTSGGRLPLNVAAERARCDLVQTLIEHGARLDQQDAEGMTALQSLTRHLERTETRGGLLSEFGKALRLLEEKDEGEQGKSLVRHFKFDKEGGQRNFGRSYPGFRFPSAASLDGEVSFTVAMRVKHNEPTGVRSGRAALLSFGRASNSMVQGFSIMMHTRGQTALGPGMCIEKRGCRFNMAVARGRWAVLACVYDAAERMLTAYLDGVQQAQVCLNDSGQRKITLDACGDIMIGCSPEGVDRDDRAKFHGVISDIRIYNKALSDEQLKDMQAEMVGSTNDGHPHLRAAFCESIGKVLLDKVRWSEVDGGTAKIRNHVSYILSRVLPFCSASLLSSDLHPPLVRYLELATTSESSPAQSTAKPERRLVGGEPAIPRTLVSVLHCIDAVMLKDAEAFEGPLRRSGLVGMVSALSCKTSAATSAPGLELQQDLAQYLLDKYFGGEDGARALPASGEPVRQGLAGLAAVFERLASHMKVEEDERAVLALAAEALAAMKDLAAMFRAGAGVYCEELIHSGLASSLLALLDVTCDSTDHLTRDKIDPYHLLEIGFQSTADDRGALGALIAALRLAADRLPLEHPEALPFILPEQEHVGPDVLALKQWVVLSLERGPEDKHSRDLTGVEVQIEPLAMAKSLSSTLEAMLQTQQPKWKDKDNRNGARQKELRAMMHAFGDDPDGTPPSLLEHIKHLMVHEHRALDAVPPITRQLLALPPIHSWDREMTERGAAKQRLVMGRDSGLSMPQAHDDDDEDALDGERSSRLLAPGERSSTFDTLSGRESPARQDGSDRGGSRPQLRMRLRAGKAPQDRQGAGSARGALSEFTFVHEGDAAAPLSPGEAEEGAASSVGRGWLTGYRASLIDHDSRAAGRASSDAAEHSIELRPDETIFEALSRLELAASKDVASQRSAALQGMHPGRFWERSFVLSYSVPGSEGEADAQGAGPGTKEVLIEVPKGVLRFVTGRAGCGVRKMERESGARIVSPNRSEAEAVFTVSGTQEEIDEAMMLIHAAARAAASWRESRDGPMLARNPRATTAQSRRGAAFGASSLPTEEESSDVCVGSAERTPGSKRGSTRTEESRSPNQHRAKRQRVASEDAAECEAPGMEGADMELEGASSSSSRAAPEEGQQQSRASAAQELEFLAGSRIRPCILLLHRLASRFGNRFGGSDAFASPGLGLHLGRQLEDALVVGSGMLKRMAWVMDLCKLPPVIPLAVRERCFTACALGTSRALASCSSSGNGAESHANVDESHPMVRSIGHAYGMQFTSRPIHQDLRVPPLVRETVDIDHRREGHEDKLSLLEWAEKVLTAHGSRDTVLDVTWKGEAGHGSGPTRKFFEKVAALLESEEENAACRVWRDVEDARKDGLFPAPLPEDNEERTRVLSRLRLVGLFMAKALQQGQMPGLCLATPLFKLILGLPLGFHDVKDLDKELHAGVVKVVHWQQKKDDVLADAGLSDDARRAQLEDIDKDVCMLWNEVGEPVTCENLDEYTKEVVKSCMAKLEVPDQVAAIREGIGMVLPWQMLTLFQPVELQQKLWSDLEWDQSKLERIVRPGPMWPQDKDQIEWLRQEMMAMDMKQRRAFVKFVTASVCMPLEENPIIVHPQVALRPGTEDWDKKLPTCRTCANYLYLPPYSTASILQQRLRLAMWEEHIAFD